MLVLLKLGAHSVLYRAHAARRRSLYGPILLQSISDRVAEASPYIGRYTPSRDSLAPFRPAQRQPAPRQRMRSNDCPIFANCN